MVVREPLLQKVKVVSQHLAQMLNISAVSEALILDENRHGEAPHIGEQLAAQTGNRFAMAMVNNSLWVVLDAESAGQDAVPQFRISAATRGADVEALVEVSCFFKDIFPEGHVCSRSDLPHRWPLLEEGPEEMFIVYLFYIPSVEGPEFFEYHFGFRFQRSC